MANMSYCAFFNTVQDMQDIVDRLREVNSLEELMEDCSDSEQVAIKQLPQVCAKILELYDNL
jgi:hypothetical protein